MSFWCCCGGGGGTGDADITVKVCGVAKSGISVAAKLGGVTQDTKTTNSSGVAAFTGLTTGSYTFEASGGPTGTETTSINVTVVTSPKATGTINMTISNGYGCSGDPCSTSLGTAPYVQYTYPDTLWVTDAIGDVELTRISNGSDGSPQWEGIATRTAAKAIPSPTPCTYTYNSNIDVPVYFKVRCSGAGSQWRLIVACWDAYGKTQPDNPCGWAENQCSQGETGSHPCDFGSGEYWPSPDQSCLTFTSTDAIEPTPYLGNYAGFTPSSLFPSLAGSATVSFLACGGSAHKRMPWQIYGNDETFTVSQ
jgi:hypothetical protein